MKILALAAAVGVSALSINAVAAQTPPPKPPQAMMGDTNGDRVITRAEFMAQAEANFARMDADDNGQVTAEERRANRQAMRPDGGKKRAFAAAAPGPANGPLAGMERMGRGGRGGGGGGAMLTRMDADKDGRISRAEFDTMTAQGFARRGAATGMTRADFDARAAQRFARMDSNGDGFVDAAEQAAMAAARGSRGRMMDGNTPPPAPPGV